MGDGNGVMVSGVGVTHGDAVAAGADGRAVGSGERVGVGAPGDAVAAGAGDREPGAAVPQLATTRAAAGSHPREGPCTSGESMDHLITLSLRHAHHLSTSGRGEWPFVPKSPVDRPDSGARVTPSIVESCVETGTVDGLDVSCVSSGVPLPALRTSPEPKPDWWP